jgi:hypothetical protein
MTDEEKRLRCVEAAVQLYLGANTESGVAFWDLAKDILRFVETSK